MTVTIIAEVGVNHDGKLDKALKLCDAAKTAGADIVKFQTYDINKLIRNRESQAFMTLGNLSMAWWKFEDIAKHCADIGIEFCSTPDDVDSLKHLVESCGVKRIKLGSGSLLYRPLVDAAFDTGLPVLLSTGMATKAEIQSVVTGQSYRFGHWIGPTKEPPKTMPKDWLTLIHCVSLYPCPPRLANVGAINDLRGAWAGPIGYSDHTIGNYAVLAAVALGAAVIEKHFTLDNEAEGPDHRMSATPEQFETMVMKIRQTEVVLGHGHKEPSEEELAMIPRIRKDANGFQPGL